MANAVEARWHGDDYQSRYFWILAASLRDPQRQDVVEVMFEADGPKAFDDVVIRYDPGRPSNKPHRVTVDYHQIKWHTVKAGRFGYADLIDPSFIGATKKSILQRLQEAKKGAPSTAAFTLVTTDRIRDDDLLGQIVSQKDHALDLHRLFDGTGDRSKTGVARKLWREHLELQSDEELRAVLEGFHVRDGHHTLEDMRVEVSRKFRAVGLHGCEHTMEFRYDDAARMLKVKGVNTLTRDTFEALCREENWFEDVPTPARTNVSVRSFSDGSVADGLDASHEFTVSLVDLFDRRFLKDGLSWDGDVAPQVRDVLNRALFQDERLRLYLNTHASIAFFAGSVLGLKSSANVELIQKGRAPNRIWFAGDGADGPSPVISEETAGSGKDIAVAVGMSRPAGADVRSYVAQALPSVGKIIDVTPAGGDGQSSINGGAHAATIAHSIANAVNADRRPGATVHLFVSAPNALSFFLGQNAASMGDCISYEFDFERRVDGAYRPAFRI